MDKSLLVKLIGFPATLLHGDALTLDRWIWLRKHLHESIHRERLVDIGCGTGAFSIGAAIRGYDVLGLSWDERNQRIAGERAEICKVDTAKFEILDIRQLDRRKDLYFIFDVAICFEVMEHIINDRKLIHDIANFLRPGGRLLLTTPYLFNRPITSIDEGPFSDIEEGGHVRRGYTKSMLEEICRQANLVPKRVSYCSGFFSQKITFIQRVLSNIHPLFGWGIILPFRLLPPLFDQLVTSLLHWPYYSICLEAYKPSITSSYEAVE